jgi:hypothetical protein
VRNIWSEQLPPGDPIFTGGVRLVFGEPSSDVRPEEDDVVGFVSPSVPGRRVRLVRRNVEGE